MPALREEQENPKLTDIVATSLQRPYSDGWKD